jgi:hypothetical protein
VSENVRAFRSLSDLRPCAQALRALNLSAKTPSPFHTFEYLDALLKHREQSGFTPLFVVAFDAGRPIGFLPLKVRSGTVTLLEPRPPHLIARPEDEGRVAAAMWKFLVSHEGSWSVAELAAQDDRAPLSLAAAQLNGVTSDRLVPVLPVLEATHAPSARQARRLLEAGELEFLACDDRRALKGLLDLYLDLEVRSGRASLLRHPSRIERVKSVAAPAPGNPTSPLFHWLLLDGLPIAGLLSLRFGANIFPLEQTCDDAFRALEPCDALMALAAQDALARDATLRPPAASTFTLRVRKRWNLRFLADNFDLLKHWTFTAPVASAQAGVLPAHCTRAPDAGKQLRARTRALDVLARIEGAGVCVDRLAGDALELPLGLTRPRLSRSGSEALGGAPSLQAVA